MEEKSGTCFITESKAGKKENPGHRETQCRCEKWRKGGAERSVHTMYMAHTQSCAEHMTHRLNRTRHLEDGCWMGIQRKVEKPGRPQVASLWGGGKTTCKSKSGVQPPVQKHETLYLSKLMKHKEAFLGFCENT